MLHSGGPTRRRPVGRLRIQLQMTFHFHYDVRVERRTNAVIRTPHGRMPTAEETQIGQMSSPDIALCATRDEMLLGLFLN